MDTQSIRPEASFVIRLWLEPGQGATVAAWRGHVRHVQSGEEFHFSTLDGLLAYVAAKSGARTPHHLPAPGGG